MIKEYADRIREEIKKIDSDVDKTLDSDASLETKNYVCTKLEGMKRGFNEALDIYLDLVKEDI